MCAVVGAGYGGVLLVVRASEGVVCACRGMGDGMGWCKGVLCVWCRVVLVRVVCVVCCVC